MSHEPPMEESPPGIPNPFGPFELLHPLGSGAAGTVFLAELIEPRPYAPVGSRLAVKVLDPARIEGHGLLLRFQREADLGRQVVHPGVVRTHDVGCVRSAGTAYHYLVMEHVQGRTLREIMRELGVLPEPLLRDLALQIVEGLEAIHGAGAAHRDLKPGNILITPDYQVKLMDLGVAYLLESSSRLTRDGYFVGTLLYAAPEQIRGEVVGPAADLYSLGVVLYEAATAVNPFEAPSSRAAAARQLSHVPPRAGDFNPHLSAFLEEVMAHLMEKLPSERFGSSRELRQVLQAGEASPWWTQREKELRRSHPDHHLERLQVVRETPFVGRFHELQTLRALFRDAKAGRGRAVLVEGEAGVGKTRLVDELACQLHHAGEPLVLLYGRAAADGGERPGGALAASLLDYLGESRLEAKLARYLAATPHLVPGFAAWLTGRTASEPISEEALQAVFAYLLCVLSAEAPLLWVLDDLHADTSTVRSLFAGLSRAATENPVLLVATARPAGDRDEMAILRDLPGLQHLSLKRLSRRQVEGLLRDLLNTEVAAATVGRRLGGRSAGNPFFIVEMIRELRDKQLLGEAVEGGTFSLSGELASVVAPDSVRALLEERLAEVSPAARALLQQAAVAGPLFDPDLLARSIGENRLKVLEALASVERQTEIVRASGSRFVFDHPQLQEALYRSLAPEQRVAAHRRLAAAFADRRQVAGEAVDGEAAVFQAMHFLKGEEPERGLPHVPAALDFLARTHQSDALLALAEPAFAAARSDVGLTCEIRLHQAESLRQRGRWREEKSFAEQAVALARLAGSVELEARAWLAFARVRLAAMDFAGARRLAQEARRAVVRRGAAAIEADALELLGRCEGAAGRREAARELFELQAAVAAAAGDPALAARARCRLAALDLSAGRYARACESFAAVLPELSRLELLPVRAEALTDHGLARRCLGEFPRARQELERALELARRAGVPELALHALTCLGRLAVEEARLPTAQHQLETALGSARSRGLRRAEAEAQLALGELSRCRGDRDEAERRFQDALELQHALAAGRDIARTSFALGRLMVEQRNRRAAAPLLSEAANLVRDYALDAPGDLPAAYLTLLGEPLDDEPFDFESGPVLQRAELHLVQYRIRGEEPHLARCEELLETVAGHLTGEDRRSFWKLQPVARAAAKLRLRSAAVPIVEVPDEE